MPAGTVCRSTWNAMVWGKCLALGRVDWKLEGLGSPGWGWSLTPLSFQAHEQEPPGNAFNKCMRTITNSSSSSHFPSGCCWRLWGIHLYLQVSVSGSSPTSPGRKQNKVPITFTLGWLYISHATTEHLSDQGPRNQPIPSVMCVYQAVF